MSEIGGTVDPGFEGVREAFVVAQAEDDGGAQLCVYRHGRRVVDLWGGRDPVNDRPFDSNTLAMIMSCTKGAVAVCAHILLERDLLKLDAPVARYWPEFAQNGKQAITVRHVLTHSAGLMGIEPESGLTPEDILDEARYLAALEKMAPLWKPGTAYFYHFISYGYLVGEIVRRVTGLSVGQFLAREVAAPLDLDLWIGLPEAEDYRVAPHVSKIPRLSAEQWTASLSEMGLDVNTRVVRTLLYTFVNTDELIDGKLRERPGRAVELAAGNGITNARSLAKMYAALIGQVDGVRLLKPETMERARTLQTGGLSTPSDLAKLKRVDSQKFGLGFELPYALRPMMGAGSFGHSGAGGRLAYAQPETGLAVAYVCNTMLVDSQGPDPRWLGWIAALQAAIG
jgi:CubicO group peptidase (beta-lactamase class C family)